MSEVTQILLGVIAAPLLYAYWLACQRLSLRFQKKAADMIEVYFAKDSATEESVAAVDASFRFARHWMFMPVGALAAPLVILAASVSGPSTPARPDDEAQEIMNAIMMMYISRNPLTAIFCFYFVFVVTTPLLICAAILNRVRVIPNPLRIYGQALARLQTRREAVHSH